MSVQPYGFPAPPPLLSNGPLYSPPANNVTSIQQQDIQPVQPVLLANASQAVLQQRLGARRSHLDIVLPIGPSLNGPRTLLPRLLVAGSAQTKAMLEQAGKLGIQTSATAQGDVVVLKLSGPAQQERQLVNLAMTLLTQPRIDPALFAAEREDTLKQYTQEQALPEMRLDDLITRELYGANHPYAETRDRLMRQLQVQTPATVLSVLRQAMGQPANVSMQFISPLATQAQADMLNQAIRQFGWTGYPTAPLPLSPAVRYVSRTPVIMLPDNTLERAHIQVAWRAPNVSDPDYPTFLVLLNLLDGFNGRFFQQLRTKQGLVYSTMQSYENYHQAAEYRLNTEVDFNNIKAALKGINKVLQGDLETPGLLTHLVSDRELTRAKKAFILNTRATIQSIDGLAKFNQPMLLAQQLPLLPNDLIKQIEAVTSQDVYRIAHRVFGPANTRITGITAPSKVLAGLDINANNPV